jgi:transposase
MEVLVDRGAGIDVHKQSVTVCVMTTEGRTVRKIVQRFSTFHRELVALREWLVALTVTHVAMEATGEYWKPVCEVLEGAMTLIVANAHHVKSVPGRKTDPEDAAWLARLLRHGLLRASFVPPRAVRQLRDLTRLRRKTIDMSARVENRAQKVLEGAGVKLGSVLSDVFGVTGRAILRKLASNQTDPTALSELAKGTLRKKKREIRLALEGSFSTHHAGLLNQQLIIHEELQRRRASIESEIVKHAEPYAELINRLDQMPGINRDAAIEIIGETGPDMSPWPDHHRFSAWAGLCPGNHESAGKRKRVATRKGNPFLKSILVQAATSAVKTRGSYYSAMFGRFRKRMEYNRAIVAVAHAMLIAIYHMIRDNRPYQELCARTLERRSDEWKKKALINQLERLGYSVQVRTAQI